jgi:hypothetical protein
LLINLAARGLVVRAERRASAPPPPAAVTGSAA